MAQKLPEAVSSAVSGNYGQLLTLLTEAFDPETNTKQLFTCILTISIVVVNANPPTLQPAIN